jgi:hypothetical protein
MVEFPLTYIVRGNYIHPSHFRPTMEAALSTLQSTHSESVDSMRQVHVTDMQHSAVMEEVLRQSQSLQLMQRQQHYQTLLEAAKHKNDGAIPVQVAANIVNDNSCTTSVRLAKLQALCCQVEDKLTIVARNSNLKSGSTEIEAVAPSADTANPVNDDPSSQDSCVNEGDAQAAEKEAALRLRNQELTEKVTALSAEIALLRKERISSSSAVSASSTAAAVTANKSKSPNSSLSPSPKLKKGAAALKPASKRWVRHKETMTDISGKIVAKKVAVDGPSLKLRQDLTAALQSAAHWKGIAKKQEIEIKTLNQCMHSGRGLVSGLGEVEGLKAQVAALEGRLQRMAIGKR